MYVLCVYVCVCLFGYDWPACMSYLFISISLSLGRSVVLACFTIGNLSYMRLSSDLRVYFGITFGKLLMLTVFLNDLVRRRKRLFLLPKPFIQSRLFYIVHHRSNSRGSIVIFYMYEKEFIK